MFRVVTEVCCSAQSALGEVSGPGKSGRPDNSGILECRVL